MDPTVTLVSWRDSARRLKFLFLHGQAVFPIFFWAVYPRMWTFGISIASTIFFAILFRLGFSPKVFLRMLKCFFAGSVISSRPWWEK
jgi:hypothetical protein